MTDSEILKPLVETVVELAERPGEAQKKELWAQHNALLPQTKVPVCVSFEGIPVSHWDAAFGPNHIRCADPLARTIEMELKRRIWAAQNIPDDHVVWPVVLVEAKAEPFDWGVDLSWHSSADALGAKSMVAPFDEKIELSRLKPPQTRVDRAATDKRVAQARELVRDRLLVYPRYPTLGESPFEIAIHMRGMEKIFYDVVDQPDQIRGMMQFITDATIAHYHARQEQGFINCYPDKSRRYHMVPLGMRHVCAYLAPDFAQRRPQLRDEWAYVSAQSAMGLGPAMYDEFVHGYNCRISELYANKTVYYHGCECLDQKLDVIATLPNLRRHHVSPWSSVALAAMKYRNSVNLEVHCHPSKVLLGGSPESMRAEIVGLLKGAGGHRMNLNLSDIHTLDGKPQTLSTWARVAQELVGG